MQMVSEPVGRKLELVPVYSHTIQITPSGLTFGISLLILVPLDRGV